MKLIQKMTKSNILVFFLEGQVLETNLPVLQAGITHRIKGGQKKLVLDISQIQNTTADIVKELARLKYLAIKLEAHLVVVSPVPGVGDVTTLQESFNTVGQRQAVLATTMRMYKDRLESIPIVKQQLLDKLQKLKAANSEIDQLLAEQTRLRAQIECFESSIRMHLEMVTDFRPDEDHEEKMRILESVVYEVLQKEGFQFAGGSD